MIKKALTIFLSVLILAGQMGFTLATHYCGSYVMETRITLGEEELDCGMDEKESDCEGDNSATRIKNHCCDNHFQTFNLDDVNSENHRQVNVNIPLFFVLAANDLHTAPDFDSSSFLIQHLYSPPLLKQDFPVLFQSFLI
ncbi:MAG: hypothetical protein OEX02_04655 [Cyclobacteriaceae bacterium]|nr:hypothetical protein [Cyclobacteriaceae bacterium]